MISDTPEEENKFTPKSIQEPSEFDFDRMNEAIFKGLQKIVSERLNEISENSKQFVEEEVDFEPRPSRNTSKE